MSTQTCTHPTQVRTPARRVTYVSSPCTVPNCRHTPAPVTHPKWTSAHPRGMQATQIRARVRLPFLFSPGSFLVPFCPTTITLASKELSRLAPASQFLLKPGWRPAHDKAGEPGSRQLSGGGWRGDRIRPGTVLPRVASSSSSTFLVPLSEAATAGGSASRLCSPGPGRRRGGSHGARARGSRGVSLAPRLSRPDPPPRRQQQQGPRGAPGRSSWPPSGGRSPRSCPESRSPGAQLGRCRSGARCRGPRAAAAPRRAPGRPHLA